ALGWIFQLHMSWPLLLPFVAVAFLARLREGARSFAGAAGMFAIGLLATGSLVLPTLISYGVHAGRGGTEENLLLHWRNPVTTLANTAGRLLSFASFEVRRFMVTAGRWQVPVDRA